MKTLQQHIDEKLKINKDFKSGGIKPESREDLIKLIWTRLDDNNEIVDLTDVDISKVDKLNDLFNSTMYAKNEKIKEINIETWNTSHVTDMGGMFNGCDDLEVIHGIEDFDVSSVTDMEYMFRRCYKIKSLDLRNWKPVKVWTMEKMFYRCEELREIKGLDNWEVTSLKNMDEMFWGDIQLRNVNLENWHNISNFYISMDDTFRECHNSVHA